MRRVSAKFVPKLLTEEQKELQKEICKDMLDCTNHDSEFMKTIITDNETWVYGYDPETKNCLHLPLLLISLAMNVHGGQNSSQNVSTGYFEFVGRCSTCFCVL